MAYILLKSGVPFSELGDLTFKQLRLFVKYYYEERGEWLQIVNTFLGGGKESAAGSTVSAEGASVSAPSSSATVGSGKPVSALANERPGSTVEVVENNSLLSDDPLPDGMVIL